MTKLNFDISSLHVQDLLPQRAPFIFVDSVLALDPDQKKCVTQFLIKEDTLLMDQGHLSEGGLEKLSPKLVLFTWESSINIYFIKRFRLDLSVLSKNSLFLSYQNRVIF